MIQLLQFTSAVPKEPGRAELMQRISDLEGIARRRSLMMTAAGHDLRQPLQAILAAIERIPAPQSESGADFWRAVAKEQISRLSKGLAELMIASNDEHPWFNGEHRAVPLASIFEWLEAEWSTAADAKQLYMRFAPTSALVMCDPVILRTILSNLVGNSIKYTNDGGILVGCRRTGDRLAIDVIDTGCGIAPEQHQDMFDAFSQGLPSNEGFGIGLWLVQQLSRVSGHELRFWSKPGKGSRFRVSVPITRIATN